MTKRLLSDRRVLSVAFLLLIVVVGGGVYLLASGPGSAPPAVAAVASPLVTAPASTAPSADATPGVSASPSASLSPSPSTAPQVYEDLSGIATTAELAHRYPIAVMIDDSPAFPSSAGRPSGRPSTSTPAALRRYGHSSPAARRWCSTCRAGQRAVSASVPRPTTCTRRESACEVSPSGPSAPRAPASRTTRPRPAASSHSATPRSRPIAVPTADRSG